MPDITMIQQSTKPKKLRSTDAVEETEQTSAMTEQTPPKKKTKKSENKKTKVVESNGIDEVATDTQETIAKKDKKDKTKKDKTSKMNGDVSVKTKEKTVKINGDISLKTKDKKVKVKKRSKKENVDLEVDESVMIGLTSDMDTSQNDSAIDMSRGSKMSSDSDGSDEERVQKSEDEILGAFEKFPLAASTVEKLKAKGISYLFPVQYKTFTTIHEGNDLIVQARTGTGKTMAFALPLIEKLQESPSQDKPPKVLVLTPTRELANQVCGDFESVSSQKLRMACIYGGVPYYPQEKAIRRGLDVVVGTPGRILDIIDKGWLDLSQLRHVILDEVDRMLDMGFVDDVESIIRWAYENEANNKPQTLLFSATLPVWVDKTASKYMTDNVKRIDLVGQQSIRTALTVTHLAIECTWDQRASVIADVITVYSGAHGRAMVFCEMKKDADALGSDDNMKLERHVLHGDITQSRREFVLNDFKAGKCKVLIATDVAARGLDIPSVDLVIQCTPPKDIDSYIHRSGRTGRANRKGISILLYQPYEAQALHYVEKKSGILFDRVPSPQFAEIVEAIGADARQSLQKVAPETVDNFRHQANVLLKEMDAEDALAAALSVISGCAHISPRSIMGNLKEHTSWELRSTGQEIYSKAFVFSTLTRTFPDFDTSLLRDIRHTTDRMAFVFDIANSQNKLLRENWTENKFHTLTEITSLPSLQAPMARRSNGGGSRFGGRGGGGGRGDFRRRGGGGGRDGGRRGGGGGGGYGGGGGGGGDRRGGGRGDNQFRYLKRSNRQSDGGPQNNKRTRFN